MTTVSKHASSFKLKESPCVDISIGYSQEYMKNLITFVEKQKALQAFCFTSYEEFEMKHGKVLRIYTKEASKLVKLLEFHTPEEHKINTAIAPYVIHMCAETAGLVEVSEMGGTIPFFTYERRRAEEAALLKVSLRRRKNDLSSIREPKPSEPVFSDSMFTEVVHANA